MCGLCSGRALRRVPCLIYCCAFATLKSSSQSPVQKQKQTTMPPEKSPESKIPSSKHHQRLRLKAFFFAPSIFLFVYSSFSTLGKFSFPNLEIVSPPCPPVGVLPAQGSAGAPLPSPTSPRSRSLRSEVWPCRNQGVFSRFQ